MLDFKEYKQTELLNQSDFFNNKPNFLAYNPVRKSWPAILQHTEISNMGRPFSNKQLMKNSYEPKNKLQQQNFSSAKYFKGQNPLITSNFPSNFQKDIFFQFIKPDKQLPHLALNYSMSNHKHSPTKLKRGLVLGNDTGQTNTWLCIKEDTHLRFDPGKVFLCQNSPTDPVFKCISILIFL